MRGRAPHREQGSSGLADRLVRGVAWIVPEGDRREWSREWTAELEAARRAGVAGGALLRFAGGSLPHALWLRREELRSAGWGLDLRVAARALLRRPAFALSVVATLALGLAASASVFALLDGVLLRTPAGVQAPDGLVQIGRSSPDEPGWNAFSWRSTEVLREASRAFDGVEGYSITQVELGNDGSGGGDRTAFAHFVTGGWFALLGVRPALGRLIDGEDTREIGGTAVAVLGHDLWRTRFGGDPSVVGRRVELSGERFQVVGVAPEGFSGIHTVGIVPELFLPATLNPGWGGDLPFDSWQWAWLTLVGRLAPGVDLPTAEAEAERLGLLLTEADPDREPTSVHLVPGVGVDPVRRDTIQEVARATGTVAGLLLLLTCVTVANLLLSRAVGRRTDTRVRIALGADRRWIVRHHLAESVVLAGTAAAVGLPLLSLGTAALPRFIDLPLVRDLSLDPRLLGILGVVLLGVTLLFGWIPGRIAARQAGTPGRIRRGQPRTGRVRSGLLVAQFSISLAFLAAAGLLGRSVLAAWSADPGFEDRGLWGGFLWLDGESFDGGERAAFADRVVAELRDRPEVRAAAWSTQLPIAGGQNMGSVSPLGRPELKPQVEMTGVGDGWFETLGISLVAGRAPSGSEPGEVVISRGLGELLFPGEDPLGRRLEGGLRVVGLAPDVRMRSLRAEGNPAVWYFDEAPFSSRVAISVSMRRGAESRGGRALEAAVARVDPGASVTTTRMRSEVLAGVGDARRLGVLLGGIAALALLLTAAGIFGVAAQRAAERRHEFGIRLTLGADPGALPRLLLGGWAWLCLAGLLGGGVGAVAMGHALDGILFETSAADPWALGAAGLVLAAVALVATWWPAARAARIDPLDTIREVG